MPDLATPNLPSRDFDATVQFFTKFGFECGYRADNWMILHRGPKGSRAVLEFFPYPDLNPLESSFGACIRLDDLAEMVAQIEAAGVPDTRTGYPRIHPPQKEASGLTIAYLTDPDGSLLRLIQND
ncbi:bleomycin resistance protein [Erythrobacter sp. NAP1]|uniref:bleomycin resistance protein n=1 Tax=Erythrobacter sp. NAP1 TaxID=237727 RepID=UPI0000686A22|nr:bleomycin resistance protein [Erythrobacter sp. NAP1]EAQ30474.1 bleomycin resistance protein [Erythrobacter sp. NAP1]